MPRQARLLSRYIAFSSEIADLRFESVKVGNDSLISAWRIISVWRIVLIGIFTRAEGQHKQERKQEREYSFCQFVNLLSRISCGGGGGVLADRLAGVFYFKILNLPIMGSSFALPFSALMMPMTARTVITMLRMGAMIHPRMGMIQSTDEISPHRNSTSP